MKIALVICVSFLVSVLFWQFFFRFSSFSSSNASSSQHPPELPIHPRTKHFFWCSFDGLDPPLSKSAVAEIALKNKPLRVVWAFWFGGLENMSPARKRALEMMRKNLGVPLRLITSMDEAKKLSKPEAPIHPLIFHEPQVLSSNHIVDYLRGYIMNHYGGGYLDVKPIYRNWSRYFDLFDSDPNVWFLAPRQRGMWDPGCDEEYLAAAGMKMANCFRVRENWAYLGSDACWIARPYTPLSIEFQKLINDMLNRKWKEILKYPVLQKYKHRCCSLYVNANIWKASFEQQNKHPDYALRWVEVHADAFDPLQLKWNRYVRLGLPRYDSSESYA